MFLERKYWQIKLIFLTKIGGAFGRALGWQSVGIGWIPCRKIHTVKDIFYGKNLFNLNELKKYS